MKFVGQIIINMILFGSFSALNTIGNHYQPKRYRYVPYIFDFSKISEFHLTSQQMLFEIKREQIQKIVEQW